MREDATKVRRSVRNTFERVLHSVYSKKGRKEGKGEGVEFLNVNRWKVVRESCRWKTASVHARERRGCWWAGIGAFILGPRLLFFLRAVATNFPSSFCSHWAPSGECQAFPLSAASVAQCRVALAAVAPETNF